MQMYSFSRNYNQVTIFLSINSFGKVGTILFIMFVCLFLKYFCLTVFVSYIVISGVRVLIINVFRKISFLL